MSPTLPLFLELEPWERSPDREPQHPAGSAGAGESSQSSLRKASRPRRDQALTDPHLRAAWRLARTMRRLPANSTEQTRTGLAICAHLQASLAEAERRQAG